MKSSFLFVVAAVGLIAGAAQAATPLVTDGKGVSVIVTSDRPLPSQKFAAEELQYHLEKMTGAKLPILTESQAKDEKRTLILVGQSQRLSALGIVTAKLPPETLVVKSVGQTLILAGEDGGAELKGGEAGARTGTLFAVYDFLQDQLGCRWLWPGPTGEVIPKRATVAFGPLDIQETPQLFRRHFRSGFSERLRAEYDKAMPAFMAETKPQFDRMQEDEQVWLKRMRMGRSFDFSYGHAFTSWWKRYGKTQPDLFALLPSGKRGPASSKKPEFVKMCVSNPKLVEMLVKEFTKAHAKNPDHRFLNACEDDGRAGFCTCDKCKAWDVAGDEKPAADAGDGADVDAAAPGRKDGLPASLTNRYFHFYNNLARELSKVSPDATVVAYAYSRYRKPPVGMKLEPNILIGQVNFNMYPMSDAERAEERRNYQAWHEAGGKNFLRPNVLIFAPAMGVPWSAAHQMGEDFQFAVKNGAVASDYDFLTGQYATAGPVYYLLARLQWDTTAKVDDILNEFYGGFGPCAELVKEYFDHYETVLTATFNRPDIDQALKAVEPLGGRLARWRGMPLYYTDDVLAKGRAIIEKAQKVAAQSGDAGLIQRVEALALGQRHGELVIQALKIRNRICPDRLPPKGQKVDVGELMPVLNELFKVRKSLADLGAENVFHLAGYELTTAADLILSSAWHQAQSAPKP